MAKVMICAALVFLAVVVCGSLEGGDTPTESSTGTTRVADAESAVLSSGSEMNPLIADAVDASVKMLQKGKDAAEEKNTAKQVTKAQEKDAAKEELGEDLDDAGPADDARPTLLKELVAKADAANAAVLNALGKHSGMQTEPAPSNVTAVQLPSDPAVMARCPETVENVTAGMLPCPIVNTAVTHRKAGKRGFNREPSPSNGHIKEDHLIKALSTESNKDCPDGAIGKGGVYTILGYGGHLKGGCMTWTSGIADGRSQATLAYYFVNASKVPTGDFIGTKAFVEHVHRTPPSWGIVGYKRVRCVSGKCYVYKVGRCFNLSSVGGKFSSFSNPGIEDLRAERNAFAEKLTEVLEKYSDGQLPSKFDCMGTTLEFSSGGISTKKMNLDGVMTTIALM